MLLLYFLDMDKSTEYTKAHCRSNARTMEHFRMIYVQHSNLWISLIFCIANGIELLIEKTSPRAALKRRRKVRMTRKILGRLINGSN